MLKTDIDLTEYYRLMRVTDACSKSTTLKIQEKIKDGTIQLDKENKILLTKKRRILNTD